MPKTSGLARAAVETEAVAVCHRDSRRARQDRDARSCVFVAGQISIEQARIAAGVNLLLPFGPAFCFAVIVCFSLEYKILGLAGGPLVAAGVNPLAPLYQCAGSILYQCAGSCW